MRFKSRPGNRFGQRGFTLVEILVVFAIFVVMLATLFPIISHVRYKAMDVLCVNTLKNWHSIISMVANDNFGNVPDIPGGSYWGGSCHEFVPASTYNMYMTWSFRGYPDFWTGKCWMCYGPYNGRSTPQYISREEISGYNCPLAVRNARINYQVRSKDKIYLQRGLPWKPWGWAGNYSECIGYGSPWADCGEKEAFDAGYITYNAGFCSFRRPQYALKQLGSYQVRRPNFGHDPGRVWLMWDYGPSNFANNNDQGSWHDPTPLGGKIYSKWSAPIPGPGEVVVIINNWSRYVGKRPGRELNCLHLDGTVDKQLWLGTPRTKFLNWHYNFDNYEE